MLAAVASSPSECLLVAWPLAFRSLLRFLATGMKKSLTAVAIASKLDVLAAGAA